MSISKETFRKLAFAGIKITGLPMLFRRIFQKHRVTIVLFHDISKETAEMSFSYLVSKYNIISLDTFVEACRTRNQSILPEYALVITFDDGFKRNYELLSAIKSFQVPVTIFLCSSIIGTNRNFWFNNNIPDVNIKQLKKLPNTEKLEVLSNYGFDQEKEYRTRAALSKPEIEEMKTYINFQSHTKFHPCLPKCTAEVAKSEIAGSKIELEEKFGLPINSISYPNGDYSERDISLTKEAGYSSGLTVDFGFNTIHTDIYRLKRLCVNDTENINELIVKSSGVWDFFKTFNGKKQTFGWTNKVVS